MVGVVGSNPIVPTDLSVIIVKIKKLDGKRQTYNMPIVTLPDQTVRRYITPVTILQLAQDIGAGLARSALAGVVNGKLTDVDNLIEEDAEVKIITERDPEGLEVIRHSCAHLMAQAVKQLYPDVQVTIGPVIADGFYYDYSYKRSFTLEDIDAIQKRMEELSKQDLLIKRSIISRDEAVSFFQEQGETYKAEIIKTIPEQEELSLYTQGDFTDLCRGPHVPSTGKLKAFKLTRLAGAYWRGDVKNEMLQRIYGTAWADKKSLKVYLHRLEEAKKRDHRKLAKKLDLFHFQEEAPGMVFWHPNGWIIYQLVVGKIRGKMQQNGYKEVNTPQLVDCSLWEKSGHWDKFRNDMFTTSSENRDYAIKPMNCPCHVQIFNQGIKSYRDLPLRLAEFGSCHRNEPSGTLHGLMRARNFIQDDAHIFCTETQLQDEVLKFIDLLFELYRYFGFDNVLIKLSTRPQNRVGEDYLWDKAEHALEQALDAKQLTWELQPGEGAFYGPKIEFSLEDSLGRVWQCGTIQVDFSMPTRLGASYVSEAGDKQVPVMLHRAIVGSVERFIGILLEHYGGALPVWLSPLQVVVLPISQRQADYASSICRHFDKLGARIKTDLRNETIGLRIREHAMQRVPYQLIIGEREVSANKVSVRNREGEDLGTMSLEEFSQCLMA